MRLFRSPRNRGPNQHLESLQRNGETDWATGVGARQGWDGDESNVSKSKRTVGAWERVYLVVLA